MNTIKIAACTAVAAGLSGTPLTASAAAYANVVSATPAISSVATPRQECVDAEQYVQRQPSGAGALIGAIVGGVAGNQFGHGFGRAAATGLGVVAGSAIGNQVETNNNPAGAVPVRRCRTVNGYEDRVVGYDVVYDYNGQRYTTRLPQDPGPRLAIDIRPAGAAPLDRVGPAQTYSAVPPLQAERQPAYVESAPTYYEQAPAYYAAPPAYYAPAPVYYAPSTYIAPAFIGVGIGYWAGPRWHHGYRRWH